VIFLNNSGDILVGHVGKVSSVLSRDYKPFEIADFAEPPQEDFEAFMKDKIPVNEQIFRTLKK